MLRIGPSTHQSPANRSSRRPTGPACRILEAAHAVFATEGLDVPMREIARRAGVGPATLYRRFPTKEALVAEAFAEQINRCSAIVDEGLAMTDPWEGFRHVIDQVCDLHARDRGFTTAFLGVYPQEMDFAATKQRSVVTLGQLLQRAKAAGVVRPDIVVDDLILMIMAHRGICAATPVAAVAASRRFAQLFLRSARTEA